MRSLMLLLILHWAFLPGFSAQEKPEYKLRSSDHSILSKALADYFEAKEEEKKEGKTLDSFLDKVDKIEKKQKGESSLKYVADWAAILDMTREYKGRVQNGKITKQKEKQEDTTVEFTLWVPEKYDPKSAWPLLLILPENGKVNSEELLEKQWNIPILREKYILCVPQMPQEMEKWLTHEGIGSLFRPFALLLDMLHVDCDRVFLAGEGGGVAAAAKIASYFPHRFCGLILRGQNVGMPEAVNLNNLAVYFTSKEGEAAALIESLDQLEPKMHEVGEDNFEAIAHWMDKQIRNSYPGKLTFRVAEPFARSAYWMRLDRIEFEPNTGKQLPYFEAMIDQANNKITVTTQGVYSYLLYFNDSMLDLDKVVTVTSNGQEWQGTITRNIRWFIDTSYSRNDNRVIFTGTRIFDTPESQGN